jgi:hypothetical protein
MPFLKINPDLFLGTTELKRFQEFLSDDGFRKNIIQNTTKFGLIKNSSNPQFTNGKVERDGSNIKVNELFALDKNGQFLYSKLITGITVPNDGNWYWIKANYAISNIEKGTFEIAGNGDLIETSGEGELTKIFRGIPDFPTRIKFVNSTYNTLEYDVLEVIDDQHAIIQHPAPNGLEITQFEPEDNLQIKIIGTFTPGIAIPNTSKYIFNYDYAQIQLAQEVFENTRPIFNQDEEFFLARVKVESGTVIIQDKRIEYWETKGSGINLEIDRTSNPCIGIESAQYNDFYSPQDRNVIYLSWGIRSNNWSIDSSTNIVTFNSGLGGKYKSVNDFQNGNFVGGRLYYPNGKYSKIIASAKQGSAINFTVDVLDVDNLSNDGGITLITGSLMVTPDCEEVEILFTPNPSDNKSAFQESFTFPVNTLIARCDVLVFKDPEAFYNVKYRYKTIKEYTDYKPIPTDTAIGYLTEDSFDANGNLKASDLRQYYPYTSGNTNGFIRLKLSPDSIRKFRQRVDKGDLIGVENITSITTSQFPLIVGTTKDYIYVSGSITLSANFVFNVDTPSAIEGNEFRIHINCSTLNLGNYTINIVQNFGGSSPITLKTIDKADVYAMLNQEGGIIFTLKYKNASNNWIISQNYDLGRPYEIVQMDGVIDDLFDEDGLGKVRGLFGYVLCDSTRTIDGVTVPDLKERFLVGANANNASYVEGATGGEAIHTLTPNEFSHKHDVSFPNAREVGGSTTLVPTLGFDPYSPIQSLPTTYVGNSDGTIDPHNNTPLYYAIIFAKKLF